MVGGIIVIALLVIFFATLYVLSRRGRSRGGYAGGASMTGYSGGG